MIEGRTLVKCCCSQHRTLLSPRLCAIFHLCTNVHIHIIKDQHKMSLCKWDDQDCFTTVYFCYKTTLTSPQPIAMIPVYIQSSDSEGLHHFLAVYSICLRTFWKTTHTHHIDTSYTNHQFAFHCTAGRRCHDEHLAAWIVCWDEKKRSKESNFEHVRDQ